MSSKDHRIRTAVTGAGWLAHHRDVFVEGLGKHGYAPSTIRYYRRAIDTFCAGIDLRGLGPETLEWPVLWELRDTVPGPRAAKERSRWRSCIGRFLDHLVDAGVLAPPPPVAPPKPGSVDHLSMEYADWLRHQRGLSEVTIERHQAFLKRFMTFRFGATPGNLNDLAPDDILAFVAQPAPTRSCRVASWPTHLRSLFRFLFWSGKTGRNLALSIPRSARSDPPDLPCHVTPDEIRQLIEAVHTDDALGRRNHAMLLLMARLGLRAPEVIAIRIEDIAWRTGEILIRGKGKRCDRMPLPVDVGEAIVAYLRDGRASNSRHLFVSRRPPHRPFTSSAVVNRVLRGAFDKTSLKPPQRKVRTHLLRHSLAVDMLGRGASLQEIGDVLRHRSRMTTTIYARYDIAALRSVARDWPVPGAVR